MTKPFFFRIDLIELMDFATEPVGQKMSLLDFAKELKRGQSEIPQIQKIIDETSEFITKKKDAAHKRWNAQYKQNDTSDIRSNARSSNRSSSSTETESKNKKPFAPPSVEDVAAYMKSIDFDGDAENFVDRYESVGWVYGPKNTPIKCWKSVVRQWQRRDPKPIKSHRPEYLRGVK